MKKKILFILHLPQPVHGSSVVGKRIKDSAYINNAFDCDYINLSTSKSVDSIGVFKLNKAFIFIKILFNIVKYSLIKSYDKVYVAPTVSKKGFYKDFIIVFLVKLIHKHVCFHLHNKGVSKRNVNLLTTILYKHFFKGVKVILLSKYLYDDIKEFVSLDDILICPNGTETIVDLEKDLRNRKKNTIPQLLFLSNLIESKGVLFLLKACSILKNKGVDFICTFVGGEGDINSEIFNNYLKQYEIFDSVAYVGKKYGKDKHNYFLNADIFVLPTFNDCFPLVLLESMQYGLPIISTNEGGIRNLVSDGVNGFIIEKKSTGDLADKIEQLIADSEKRKLFGQKSRSLFLEKYTSETFENNLVNCLN